MNKLSLLSIFLYNFQFSIFNYQQLPDCHLVHRVCPFSGTARKWISPWKEYGAVSASGGLETVLKPSRPVVLVQLHLLVVHITITTTILYHSCFVHRRVQF